jgi:hypothetical protein
MRYDAANHPYPDAFNVWVRFGICPYSDNKIARAASFFQKSILWSPGPAKSAYELMVMLIEEKCRRGLQ